MMITAEVTGMACGMCELHVCQALENTFRPARVRALRKQNQVVIETSVDLPDEDIRKVIEDLGYTVGTISRSEQNKQSFLSRLFCGVLKSDRVFLKDKADG